LQQLLLPPVSPPRHSLTLIEALLSESQPGFSTTKRLNPWVLWAGLFLLK